MIKMTEGKDVVDGEKLFVWGVIIGMDLTPAGVFFTYEEALKEAEKWKVDITDIHKIKLNLKGRVVVPKDKYIIIEKGDRRIGSSEKPLRKVTSSLPPSKEYVVVERKWLEEQYENALKEPSDEMDKLDNLQKLFEELLGEEEDRKE